MPEKFVGKRTDRGTNCYHLLALIETFKLTGLKRDFVAEALGTSINTVRSTIFPTRTYAPGLPMVEAYLEIFEREKPGAKLYYALLLAGLTPDQSYKQAFETAQGDVTNLNLQELMELKQESELMQAALISTPKVDHQKLLESLDHSTAIKLFQACLKKPGFYEHLAQEANSLSLSEELIEKSFAMGARPEKIGAKLSHRIFGKLMQGFSPNLVSNQIDDDMDAKSLEKKSSIRGRKLKNSSV